MTMTINVSTQKVGRRIYVTGNTYAIKGELKAAGCSWDANRKQWWIGSTKAKQIEAIVGRLDGKDATPSKQDLADHRCDGKVKYKGRMYFVIGRSQKTGKLWLTVLDCSIDFWAAESDCVWVKHYSNDSDYRDHQTVGKIRRFIERNKSAQSDGYEGVSHRRAAASGTCRAPGCSQYPDGQGGYCRSCAFDEYDN